MRDGGLLVRLRVRPDTLYTSQGRTVLATGLDGFITDGSRHGLFVHETRLLSRYGYLIDGQAPTPVALSNVEQHSWLGYYIMLPPGFASGPLDEGSGQVDAASQHSLEMRVSRYVGEGFHEDVDLTNFSQQPTAFLLELDADADFADQREVEGTRTQHGRVERTWHAADGAGELSFAYQAHHAFHRQGNNGEARIHRGITLRVERATTAPRYEHERVRFAVELAPRGTWHACVNAIAAVDDQHLQPLYGCRSFLTQDTDYDRRRHTFLAEATHVTVPGREGLAPVVARATHQALRDLTALRLYDLDHGERGWTMAAGLPMYIALFGRDTLTAAWQASLASTAPMVGTLTELARWQGREVNDWRDEQPGRMLHEAHTGPLATLNYTPFARYYGSITTSAFYPVAVSDLWHWTGDKALVRPFAEHARRGLRWLDEHCDPNGDGFYEYQTRSEQG